MKRIIADKGKGFYHITTSRIPHEAEIFASNILFDYLYKSTGAVVPCYFDVERCPKRGPEIYIGNNVRGISVDTSGLSDDGFIIKTIGEDIVICGKSPRGTIYGAFHFLEKFIGFKCFTKEIERFDKVETLIVEDLDIRENPAFEYRDVFFRSAFDDDFCVKNRLNSNMALIPKEKGGKQKYFNFHHSFNELVPPDVFFDKHPEYFSFVNGERLRDRTQLCLTNEGVFQEALKTLKDWIKNNPDCRVFSVAQNDWYNNCTCENCKALDDKYSTPAATMITFVNRLGDAIKDEFPDVLLHTFAYQYTKKAPKGLKVNDNVIVRLCNIECSWDRSMEEQSLENPDSQAAGFIENIADWGKLCRHLYIWDYACNFKHYLLPFPNYKSMTENLRTYHKNNIVGVMQQGNFSRGSASGFADLEIYLASKLLWNPYQNEDKIIDEFILGVYGKEAFPYIREYIDLLLGSIKGKDLTLYYGLDNEHITDELVGKADELFRKALEVVDSEKSKQLLEKEYLQILYLKAGRMELSDPERKTLIDELYKKVKGFGISEISERIHLEVSFDNLRNSRYATDKTGQYSLYYINK